MRRRWGILGVVILLSGAAAMAFLLQGLAPPGGPSGAPSAGQLFDTSTVWTARLRVEPDPWDAMEPAGGMPTFGAGAPGSQAGPAFGPGGPPAPPADFGPGTFVAPIFMKQGDKNGDRGLSLSEVRELADRWFTDWDKDRAGKLSSDQLRDGLNMALQPQGPPPGFGSPSAPGGEQPGITFLAPDGKRNGIAGVMGIDFVWVRAAFEMAGQPLTDVDVRWKGNGTFLQSRGDLKRSFKVRFAKGTAGRKLGEPDMLNFHSNVTDASLMNETLAYRLFRDAGVPAPRTGYARVYLTVPGRHNDTYVGLYSIVEDLDNHFTIDRFGTKKGTLFKPVARRLFEDLGDKWEAYRKIYDPKTPISDEAERRVIEFCQLVSHADDEEFDAKLDRYLDLDEFSRFMAVTVWLSTLDSILAMDQNYIVYLHPKTRTFQFIPWDLDHAFGQFYPMGTPQQRENLSIHQPWSGEFLFLKRVFGVERFKRLYLARLKEINETLGRPERLQRQVDELAALLRPALADESPEKLARFDKVVAGQLVGPGGFGGPPAKVPSGGDFPPRGPPMGLPNMFGEVKPIEGFVTARHPSVREQLAGTKQGDKLGGMGFGPPGGPGPGPGKIEPGKMPVGFGPGVFWAPLLMSEFDTDKDSRLSRDELIAGFQRWFSAWDTEKTGSLGEDQVRAGLNKIFAPKGPQFGPGPAFMPGPGFGPGPAFGPSGDTGMGLPFNP